MAYALFSELHNTAEGRTGTELSPRLPVNDPAFLKLFLYHLTVNNIISTTA